MPHIPQRATSIHPRRAHRLRAASVRAVAPALTALVVLAITAAATMLDTTPTHAQPPAESPPARAYLPALLRSQPGFLPTRAILTLHVPTGYRTIAAALDAARSGDTVQVAAGTYRERYLQVPSGVRLVGAGWGSTVIDLSTADQEVASIGITLFYQATLSGFDVVGSVRDDGTPSVVTAIAAVGGSLVTNCRIRYAMTGIQTDADEGILEPVGIVRTIIAGTWVAVAAHGPTTVAHNTLVDNEVGVVVGADSAADVIDTLIVGNSRAGIRIYDDPNGDPPTAWNGTAHHNLVTDNPVDYGTGIAVGEGDVRSNPYLSDPTQGDMALTAGSPARGAASDGGDIGALPFTAVGEPQADLRVDPLPEQTPGADRPAWRATWTPTTGAIQQYVWVSDDTATTTWRWRIIVPPAFNGSDLAELTFGTHYRVSISVVTAAGPSDLAPAVTFVAAEPPTPTPTPTPIPTATPSLTPPQARLNIALSPNIRSVSFDFHPGAAHGPRNQHRLHRRAALPPAPDRCRVPEPPDDQAGAR